jgi:hypothetical protein
MENNQGFCPNCGVYAGNGNQYCDVCGSAVSPNASFCSGCGAQLKRKTAEPAPAASTVSNEGASNVQPRNLVTALIFSILTCGIYGIYWFIVLTDDLNRLTKHESDLGGGVCFLLNLVTCGIFGYIWAYKMGEKVDELNGTKGGYSAVLYLVLMLLGVGIVNYALIQDSINKAVESR